VTSDERFREIQLNGKQLVFLFMAVTVVSVVIFLLGLLVGRGVRTDRAAPVDTSSSTVAPDPVTTPSAQPPAAAPQPAAEPPAPADDTTFYNRLEKNDTPPEKLRSPAQAPSAAATTARKPPSPAAVPAQAPVTAAHPAASSAGEPPGPGFAVQVTTQPDRSSAEMLVKQLIKKGYPAYVAGPVPSGGRSIFRVRVGKYKTAKEADAVKTRLEVEEQFKPWIAR